MADWSPFSWARRLRSLGIVGLNQRNLSYINAHNDRSLFPTVDDKLQTKLLAQKHGINTPTLLGVIHSQVEVDRLDALTPEGQGFAIKPAQGSGGKGILVIQRREGEHFLKASGVWLHRRDVLRYLSNLLSGLYSLGGKPDVAVIEGLIEFDPHLARFSFEGVPDIRVVVFRGYPVMAMMRLSTRASDGKANLHQGAIGVGIDIDRGRAVRAVQYDRPVDVHPDTGKPFRDLEIPDWPELLELTARCYEMTGLGYVGTDMVIDPNRGPMLLELNARPGLAIQTANGCGLQPRLDRVLAETALRAPAARVTFARAAFATPPERSLPRAG